MSKRKQDDELAAEIRYELMPGRYVKWDEVSRLVHNLDRVHEKVAGLVKTGEPERAVQLYEVFMKGVYAKIEEADDECDLAMLFHDLACGWIQARQVAGRPAEETVGQILHWMKKDDYGFCNNIEQKLIKVLDAKGQRLFVGHFRELVDKTQVEPSVETSNKGFGRDPELQLKAEPLKNIYESLNDTASYEAICEKTGFSPKDCERLAKMEMAQKLWANALAWVEKGMALKPKRNWWNEDSHSLDQMRPELLVHLGRKEDALAVAWKKFQQNPNEYDFEQLLRYSPKKERSNWQERAMAVADQSSLDNFIPLCVKAKEWDRLALRIHAAAPAELEALSHFTTEPAAGGLANHDPLAAVKLYRALGLRIVNSGKSKYYPEALQHFKKARDLYCHLGLVSEWYALAQFVQSAHSRKSGFILAFNRIVQRARQLPET